MAVILECLDKKLEALEEACDAGDYVFPPSHASSGGSRSGKSVSKAAGQKRQLHRDDQEDGSKGGDSGDPDRNNKRAKMDEDNLPKYACPYYKYDPERFKNHRTCCGPGWGEVHRVK